MLVRRVLAPNPSPMTGPGTNTWIVGEEPVLAVIDPGPDDDAHLAAIESRMGSTPLVLVLLTHSHPDHAPLARRLAQRHGARLASHPELHDGDVLQVGRIRLQVLHTPGHSSDHLCFAEVGEEEGAIFTGDLVLGQGSTMIAHPDGDLADYLRSLDRLRELRPTILFPGHWDPVEDPADRLAAIREHRLQREAQVLAAMGADPVDVQSLTRRVYEGEAPEALMPAATLTLMAHLEKLVEEGRVEISGAEAGRSMYRRR